MPKKASVETLEKRKKLIFSACVTINKKNIYLHYLVLPKRRGLDIDHINGDFFDNRVKNLRYCTRSQNLFNKPKRKDSKQIYKGITLLPGGRYRARAGDKHLGCFDTAEEAFARFLAYSSSRFGAQFVKESLSNITRRNNATA